MTLLAPELRKRAEEFVASPPHWQAPYNKRNWGGTLHSLCSYQGKLKPSIAHFLVANFTHVGDRVLDPMAGVGTIPLEARMQGRIGLAGDLSPLAVAVSKAKLEPVTRKAVADRFQKLSTWICDNPAPDMASASFGLNGPIENYFHGDTLREIFATRAYFQALRLDGGLDAADSAILTAMLHILHGNRPYALSRRSHPITPFAPTGDFEYKSVHDYLRRRIETTAPLLEALAERTPPGTAVEDDFRNAATTFAPVDAVITSPPFSNSFRFWSTNWMRLWFAGWEPSDFRIEPARFLETEQKVSYAPYESFATSMAEVLRPGGVLILHLGETAHENMVDRVVPILDSQFSVESIGRENVAGRETHGLRDKGGTYAHWYLFARRR